MAIGLAAAALGGLILFVGAVVLVLPNSVHVDTAPADDMFFDCGGVLYPGTRPPEESGISACDNANAEMRRAGNYLLAGGGGMLVAGVSTSASGLRRSKQRQEI